MDIVVGQTSRREVVVSEETVAGYAEITGDYNPLHFDQDFAKSTRFGGLIPQGGITTGLLHALVAMDMPGPGTVFMSQS
jgi:acyl dehydratase